METVELVEQLSDPQIEDLWRLYQGQWWSQGRSLEAVRVMLAHSSLVFGLVEESGGRLVGFCRVLTDFAFRATLYDVMVADGWQGRGLGRRLLDAVTQHPRLKQVSLIGLFCAPEMTGFYEKWGFETPSGDHKWMRRAQGPG
jgi:GNAT superfamily N-acetyltransferase